MYSCPCCELWGFMDMHRQWHKGFSYTRMMMGYILIFRILTLHSDIERTAATSFVGKSTFS